jgi:DNA-binding response OmpR family regulator
MTAEKISVLHIEDDRIHQALLARNLKAIRDYDVDITVATSELDAVKRFADGDFDLIILDYNLEAGDGLSCLKTIRQCDAMVPVIALSGTATNDIAAELIAAGADDYLVKSGLDARNLEQSVRNVLTRAKAFRQRFSAMRSATA